MKDEVIQAEDNGLKPMCPSPGFSKPLSSAWITLFERLAGNPLEIGMLDRGDGIVLY
ncbi:MAG: hypothetical protein KDI38_13390 [Calditrichaeota bacterium]|nr:hypothetical protein [Calditrichota bacterium]